MRASITADIAQIIPTIKPNRRPFHAIAIKDCGEKLVSLKEEGLFAYENPHPYHVAGAPYGPYSPFMLRETVAHKLRAAQKRLAGIKPGWRIKIFDGFRPLGVQAHMVALTFIEGCEEKKWDPFALTDEQREEILQKTYRIWSPPNRDPLMPPPHSTGAAVDCTLVNEQGHDADMGSPIDFNGDISNPDFFEKSPGEKERAAHAHRCLLREVMLAEDFLQHPAEWWHFSYGDQLWVWLRQQNGLTAPAAAQYGRVEKD